ncbi:DNA-processing protein DprA [Oceanibacterium hippocampi]|uniref:Uncharacterized protein n=1 Tax=Oceanibacterium hippocampi TaxID=745714 RepID=A0A1Y5SPG6_9PROT|nr:DNA-processing protein DprA [Oceanibacterium hippocampi]SLN44174.1 hypothetical protein OCH7691_01855 [Oceanibacterium hippocampi]
MQERRDLGPRQRLDWLRLSRSENVGPVTFRQLLARYGDAAAALDALPELARRGGLKRRIRVPARAEIEAEAAALEALGGHLLALPDSYYPKALRAIDDAPPVLSVRGHPELLGRRLFAIVGARNASAAALRFTRAIAAELGEAGLVIVSGLARGHDAAAHEAALASGTIGVLGGGIDIVYPRENAGLYERMAESGCLVAEQPLGTQPQASHFPRRNRLISGLSLGVLVVEAALRSGSLITARMAADQGREVFAVPGSPLDPRARGCNGLIRDGATLVEGAGDVLAVLNAVARPAGADQDGADFAGPAPAAVAEDALSRHRPTIVEKLGATPVDVDELVRQCQVPPAIILTVLLELELAGRLERHPGNRVTAVLPMDRAEA